MLVRTVADDCLQRGAIMKLAKRFNMACSTVYRLWEHAPCMHAMSVINTPKLVSQKKFQDSA